MKASKYMETCYHTTQSKENFDRNDSSALRDIHIAIANLVKSISTLFMQPNHNICI